MKERLGTPGVACSVCALGAAFVSIVARDNVAVIGNYRHASMYGVALLPQLLQYFSKAQLQLIEGAFEDCAVGAAGSVPTRALPAVRAFYALDFNAAARARRIFSNIIRNAGEFVPADHRPALPNTATKQHNGKRAST